MKNIVCWNVASALLLALGIIYSGLAWTQGAFPEGPGRDALFLNCSQCHPLSRITAAQLTASDWEFIVYEMIARGAPVHAKDIKDLKKYLVDNFALEQQEGSPAAPLQRD